MKYKTSCHPRSLSIALVALAISANTIAAAPVSTGTANFFNGETVNASSNYGSYVDGNNVLVASGDPNVLVDQKPAPNFATAEYGTIEEINYFSFSGSTTAVGIDTINIFDAPAFSANPGGPREASAVQVYYMSAPTLTLTSAQLLDPSLYQSVGSFNLTFANTTSGTADQDSSGFNVNYQTLTVAIPAGATSVLLGFTKSVDHGSIYGPPYDYYHGIGLSEVQAFEAAAVPEPSAYLMMLGGFGVLLVTLRRRSV